MKLLTLGNTKTAKGEVKGYHTYILHLAPADLSGYNVCPSASVGCRAACLNTAGRGRFDNTQAARIRKTKMFYESRDSFMRLLVKDIEAAIRKSAKVGYTPVFRLNGTSDIRWENIPVNGNIVIKDAENIMAYFPNVQFYDYSKLTNRRNIPSNYHLTYSRSESNADAVNTWIANNNNVAVVFDTKKGEPLPESWNGVKVIDGDLDDLRFLDPQGVIVGLRGKGDAKKSEHGGFVVLTRKAA